MPYRQSYRRKTTRGRFRRRGYKPKKPVRYKVADTAYKAYQLATKVAGLVNSEFKHHQLQSNTSTSTTATVVPLNLVAQGDTGQTRDGSQIRFKSLQMNWRAEINSSASNTIIRATLGIWKRPNGTGVIAAEIYDQSSASVVNTMNQDEKKNYVILKDWFITLSINGNRILAGKEYFPLDLITRYSASNTDGAVTGMEDGQIFLITQSNEATNTPSFLQESNLLFLDN